MQKIELQAFRIASTFFWLANGMFWLPAYCIFIDNPGYLVCNSLPFLLISF